MNPTSLEDEGRLERVRAVCMALPEVNERPSHGEPTWFIRDKKTFVNTDNHHHGAAHYAIWCAAPFGAQDALISANPAVYFRPPYVGHRGWVGVRLDVPELDWDEVATVIREAYRVIAPPKLAALV